MKMAHNPAVSSESKLLSTFADVLAHIVLGVRMPAGYIDTCRAASVALECMAAMASYSLL